MTTASKLVSDKDRVSLERRGLTVEEVLRQQSTLMDRHPRVVLDRPCTIGDGIEKVVWNERHSFVEAHRAAASSGRWSKFVPASGAASRMFALASNRDKQRFCENIDRFAFAKLLRAKLMSQGRSLDELVAKQHFDDVVDAVIDSEGLGYGDLPKGLIEFHRYPVQGVTRVPLEEHLLESDACFASGKGKASLHFTVSSEHERLFADRERRFKSKRSETEFDVIYSVQHPTTKTIALAQDGEMVRQEDGQILLRPGGHGALIENLNRYQGDLIFVKNIDNVAHGRTRDTSTQWMQILGGYTALVQAATFHHLRCLDRDEDSIDAAYDFVNLTFADAAMPTGADRETLRMALIARLCRPLRVCGMVRNEGEPGGGPFWIRHRDGRKSIQIVETAEVDIGNAVQREIVHQATHFNPVFMALAVRDEQGIPFNLNRFVDDDRAIITSKPVAGREVTVLEKPGLWNGGMANWNTVFVEVPKEVFTPVKSVFDLLRDDHQPPECTPTHSAGLSAASKARGQVRADTVAP